MKSNLKPPQASSFKLVDSPKGSESSSPGLSDKENIDPCEFEKQAAYEKEKLAQPLRELSSPEILKKLAKVEARYNR